MKRRTKIGLIVALLLAGGGVGLWYMPNAAQRDLAATLNALRQQGFKVHLTEFDFSISPPLKQRAATFVHAIRTAGDPRARISGLPASEVMLPAESDYAVAAWRLKEYPGYQGEDLWPQIRQVLAAEKARLDQARQAILSGPIRFQPLDLGPNFTLPHLSELRDLERNFGMETALALRDGNSDAAWENLLAATCIVTEYAPEPIEISHLVRVACALNALQTTWSALQSPGWTDAQLAELQRRWQAVDFWDGLAETAAFSRAHAMAVCDLYRQEPPVLGLTFQEIIDSPQGAWYRSRDFWRQVQYRRSSIYEDQKTLLLYYRDRELELRDALGSTNWQQMRTLPGITNNPPPLQSQNPASLLIQMNLRLRQTQPRFQGAGLMSRTAEGETRRRLVVTALALERYQRRNGVYPATLQQLGGDLLPFVPVDFMDGQPLRYRLSDDGHFVLYSVGLDGVDNGGMQRRNRRLSPEEMREQYQGRDVVWPRPANPAEIEELVQQQTDPYARRRYGSPGPIILQPESSSSTSPRTPK